MIKNKSVSFLSNFNTERKRRILSSKTFDKKALLEWNNVINSKKLKNDKTQLLNYFNYSKNVKYLHHQTVNRKKQWNKKYKEKYYKVINSHHKNTRIIKIIIKLDNLFIIGMCKSDLTRKRYIAEIEDYILPMVKKDIPILSKYFYGLIIQSYELGYYGSKKK